MSAKPIIAVTGATGAQGGGVVDAILAEQHYTANARAEGIDVERLIALCDAVQARLPAGTNLLA